MVCILTGHELKDPNATVKYHTGVKTKEAKQPAAGADVGAEQQADPGGGRYAVDRGGAGHGAGHVGESAAGGYVETPTANLPFVEY